MLNRVFLGIPVVCLFVLVTLVLLVARAPRTWAAHWSTPGLLPAAASVAEFGAAEVSPGKWDLLWVDDDQGRIVYDRAGPHGKYQIITLQRGEEQTPSLLTIGRYEIGVWIRNLNGSTELMAATLRPASQFKIYRLIESVPPIEHPYLFRGPHGAAELVLSWQKYGNFDVFLISLRPGNPHPLLVRRLTRSQYYSFYPRAATDSSGTIHMLHLEACCRQLGWNVIYQRFTASGTQLGKSLVVHQLQTSSGVLNMPGQWGEDIQPDDQGGVWGAYSAGNVYGFVANHQGNLLAPPRVLDGNNDNPEAVALAPGRSGGYLFWEQGYELGSYVDSQSLSPTLNAVGSPNRAVYESAVEADPHVAVDGAETHLLWQAETPDLQSRFEDASYRSRVDPTVAQRLGLGLGNPWQSVAILLITSFGLATLTTMGNILTVFAFGLVGLGLLYLLGRLRVRGKWVIFGVLLTAALYLTFVTPGGPILFLSTMPAMGLPAEPFGILATAGAFGVTLWMGVVALKRVEDVYRAGLLIILGVYFFAFIEAAVFVQQRLGFI